MTDITIQNFETELLQASMQQPVLLDIWAPWCGPCKSLGPVLEKLEVAYAGRFKLTKLNSDEQPEISSQLSQAFGVRSIPFCVMFVGGQPVDGFVGAIPEAQIREFLDKHVPSGEMLEAEADLAEAEELLAEGDLESALTKLQQAVETDPANETARYDYIKALLELGLLQDAKAAFAPVAAQAADTITPHARFAALGQWLAAIEQTAGADVAALQSAIAANKRDFEARYTLARTHLAGQRFTEAMDELLEIIMRDKAWNGEAARKSYVAILELLTKPAPKAQPGAEAKGTLELSGKVVVPPSDPLLDQYRRKLSMALF
ncbi:tetratricopeptide repeat protein [Paucibacter sp. XJ19-41]|uniref:tetratricopeptide repeat protein n=1 Tax=Paucibacter sp. XJ19-41 TaxID=2927824 RepID=UPI0023497AB9|nr:tetratricopeptide repeat protein [Paucibacter sp. XJ19-41]MDC6169880.1 tetratricopeptide repeat protein [Paucibacter sp. XJ19-41]